MALVIYSFPYKKKDAFSTRRRQSKKIKEVENK
jgi:hypothetical protein